MLSNFSSLEDLGAMLHHGQREALLSHENTELLWGKDLYSNYHRLLGAWMDKQRDFSFFQVVSIFGGEVSMFLHVKDELKNNLEQKLTSKFLLSMQFGFLSFLVL